MSTEIKKEDLKFPEKVYKYRDWSDSYHQKVLKNNEVFMSSPKLFNDPFDCRITANFSLLNSNEKKKEYVDYLFSKHKSDTHLTDADKKRVYNERLNELINEIQGFQKRADDFSIDMYDDVFGVLSLSCVWDNLLMWSHYAKNHTGFCVGFHEEKMRNSDLFGKGGKVLYVNKYPEIHPLQEFNQDEMETAQRYFKMTHVKAEDWKYEQEYRLMTTYNHRGVTTDERKVTVPDEFYTEIILGCGFPKDNVAEMIDFGRQKKIPVYQSEKVPFEFKLKRNLLYKP